MEDNYSNLEKHVKSMGLKDNKSIDKAKDI
jgi:hypothetical protein